MPDPITVDPDLMAELREKAPDMSLAEAYDEAVQNCLTFDYDTEVPEGDS